MSSSTTTTTTTTTSAFDVTTLTNDIMSVIQNDTYTVPDLLNVLGGISTYINDPTFVSSLNQIITIITTDRDGNNTFDINDLTLMGKDPIVMTQLVTSILLLIASLPGIKLQYNDASSEEFIFKILAYVFLVIVPQKTNHSWTLAEKQSVVSIVVSMYQLIQSTQMAQQAETEVVSWFKSKGWCKCTGSSTTKQSTVEQNLPNVQAKLSHAMTNVRDRADLEKRIKILETQVAESKVSRKTGDKKKSASKNKKKDGEKTL